MKCPVTWSAKDLQMLEGCLPEATQENIYSYNAWPYLDTLSSTYMYIYCTLSPTYMYISCIFFIYRANSINTGICFVVLAPHFSWKENQVEFEIFLFINLVHKISQNSQAKD